MSEPIWVPLGAAASSIIPVTIFDAKGDLLVGTAADVADRLAVGANNEVLLADSSQAKGMRWGSAPLRTPIGVAAISPPGNNLNSIVESGWYNGSNMTNAPTTDWWYVFVIYVNANYQRQEAFQMISTNPAKWQRQNSNGWGSWVAL